MAGSWSRRKGLRPSLAEAMKASHPVKPYSSFPTPKVDPLVARIRQVIVAPDDEDAPAPVPRVLADRPSVHVPALGEMVHYRPRGVRGRTGELPAIVVAKGPTQVKGRPQLALSLRCMYPGHTNDLIVEGVLHGRTPGTWHWSDDRCEVYR